MNKLIIFLGLAWVALSILTAATVDLDVLGTVFVGMTISAGFTAVVYSRSLAVWWNEDGGSDAIR